MILVNDAVQGVEKPLIVVPIVLAAIRPVDRNLKLEGAGEGRSTVLRPSFPGHGLLVGSAALAQDAAIVEYSVELVGSQGQRQEGEGHTRQL